MSEINKELLNKMKEKFALKSYFMTFRIRLLTEAYGTTTTDPEVYRKFYYEKMLLYARLAGQDFVQGDLDKELSHLPIIPDENSSVQEIINQQIPLDVWPRENKALGSRVGFFGYMITGILKNAGEKLSKDESTNELLTGVKGNSWRKVVSECVRPSEFIYWELPEGTERDSDGMLSLCQRPVRIKEKATGQEMSVLKASEVVPAGSTATFTIKSPMKSVFPLVVQLLSFGEYTGIGERRSGGKGSFEFEILDCSPEVLEATPMNRKNKKNNENAEDIELYNEVVDEIEKKQKEIDKEQEQKKKAKNSK